MKPFSFTKEHQGKEERRVLDLDSVVFIEEFNFPPKDEQEEVNYAVVHMNVTHDMQFTKKQTTSGKVQEYAYALVPMTIRIVGKENVDRLFAAYESK